MIVIGVTGSIGMGKSTITGQLALLGAKACNSDHIVHRLLASGGKAVPAVAEAFPFAVEKHGVNRKKLGEHVFHHHDAMHTLEKILHPLVVEEQERFISAMRAKGVKYVVLDIPLLFETGAEERCDLVLVASAPSFVQRSRVLARPNMTRDTFEAVLGRQLPDREKRRRADAVIYTGLGKAYSMQQLKWLLSELEDA